MTRIDFDSVANDSRNNPSSRNFTNPSRAIDGNVLTTADSSSFVFPGAGLSWRGLVFHLPFTTDLSSVTMSMNICGGGATPNTVQTSVDGVSWTSRAFTVTTVDATWRRVTLTGGPITGVNYVALVEQESGFNCWVKFAEVYADGTATGVPPEPPDPPPPDPLPAIRVTINGVEFTGLREQTFRTALNDAGSCLLYTSDAADE